MINPMFMNQPTKNDMEGAILSCVIPHESNEQ